MVSACPQLSQCQQIDFGLDISIYSQYIGLAYTLCMVTTCCSVAYTCDDDECYLLKKTSVTGLQQQAKMKLSGKHAPGE